MNPYLKILPPLKADFSAAVVLNDIIEESLTEIIRDYNLLTYLDFDERLPDQLMIENSLNQRGITTPHLSALLWVLGHSFEVLPVPMLPKIEDFNQLHYIVNNGTIIDSLMKSVFDNAASLYKSIHGKDPDLEKLKSISENPIYYSEMGDEHRELYILCRISTVLAHYDELRHSDLQFMSTERVKERRRGAVNVLERHANRNRTTNSDNSTLLSIVADESAPSIQEKTEKSFDNADFDDLHFVIKDIDMNQAATPKIEPKLIKSITPSAINQTSSKRAVDAPQWQDFEKKHKDGLSWTMVLEKFGANMVIRILLRRKDYRQLLALMQGNFIASEAELKNCQLGLEKIKQNNDIQDDNAADYAELYEYLRSKGF